MERTNLLCECDDLRWRFPMMAACCRSRGRCASGRPGRFQEFLTSIRLEGSNVMCGKDTSVPVWWIFGFSLRNASLKNVDDELSLHITMNDLEVPKLKHTNGNTISINENPFVIGRALNCNYVIPNAQISRHHCSIEKADGDWFFRDISTNGCYLNGVLVKKDQKPLSDNDVIALCLDGSYDFTFQTSQSRDTSISDEQLNMVADSLDTVLSQTETSTVPISKTPSIPINERPVSSGASSPKRSRIELAASINHEPITTGVNEVEVTTVPISEISSVSVQHVSVISVPDTSPSPKTYRLALSSSVNNVDNTSNIVPSTATLPICDNPEINLQNTSTISDTNTLPVPIEIIQPSSSVEKPEESIIIPPLPEQQYEEMEDEMMCSICSDMFFKAVTLNCAHTFCKYCIEKWKKNRNICPICRAKITTMNATLVLDNVIQKIVKTLPEDQQKRRVEVLEERERELRPPPVTQTVTRGRGRATRGNRGGRGNARGNLYTYNPQPRMAQPNVPRFLNPPPASRGVANPPHIATISSGPAAGNPTALAPSEPIEVSDEEESDDGNGTDIELTDGSDDYWDDDDDDVYQRNRRYYGGYGYCFACGSPDHWANSCPYRRW